MIKPSGLNIFLVENHPDTRESLSLLLQAFGHTVAWADNIRDALRELPESGCDVLISDISLSDGTGWELLEQLRELRLAKPVYAIAISGYGMLADRERSKAAGYKHHLTKPMAPEQLQQILDEVARA